METIDMHKGNEVTLKETLMMLNTSATLAVASKMNE